MNPKEQKKIEQEYAKVTTNESDESIYSLRGPIGFSQRVLVERAIIRILNQNDVSLKGKGILDIGCGDGGWLRFLAELRSQTGFMMGIDLAEGYLAQGRQVSPNIHFLKENILDFNYTGSKFDLITEFVAFMYLTKAKDRQTAFTQVSELLAPGGYFLFFDIWGDTLKDGKYAYNEKDFLGFEKKYGLKRLDTVPVFKNFINARKEEVSVAYLGQYLSLGRLLQVEDEYPDFTTYNNMMILFRKEK